MNNGNPEELWEGRNRNFNAWGIHNDTLTTELVDEGFVSIGWDELGDLRQIGGGREGLKSALADNHPGSKPRAIAGWAGVLNRFYNEIQAGDIVVAPYKPDSTINIGVVTGDYEYDAMAPEHRHRRRVEWKKIGISRTVFTQPALYELGAFLTVFRIRKHTDEFIAALNTGDTSTEEVTHAVETVAGEQPDEEIADEPRASRIERHTRDFILETLHRQITHQEFEEFTAALLRALGYQARVTSYTQDGGVDVVAHRDVLGVEPPQIKIQCKHQTGTIGAPDVQQLVGTQGQGELSIFVTLGTYSRDAQAIERQRTGLRLITGEHLVSLVLDNYSALNEKWRARIPLTTLLVVADTADN